MSKKVVAAIGAVAVAAACASCGTSSSTTNEPAAASDSQVVEVRVFAAASLRNVFDDFEHKFEASHPGVDVIVNYAGSQDLVAQLQSGAPADLLATASQSWMQKAQESKAVTGESKLFASNSLELAVSPSNPHHIASINDLANQPDLVTVRCAPAVPCGKLTDTVLSKIGTQVAFDTEQNSVTDVLGLVEAGQADAGIVYRTDVVGSKGKVEGVEISGADSESTKYPIALTGSSTNQEQVRASQEFMDYVLSDQGQSVLKEYGFLPAS